jgi:hypothetical protein
MVIISGRQVEEWKGPKISGTEKTTTHVMNLFFENNTVSNETCKELLRIVVEKLLFTIIII